MIIFSFGETWILKEENNRAACKTKLNAFCNNIQLSIIKFFLVKRSLATLYIITTALLTNKGRCKKRPYSCEHVTFRPPPPRPYDKNGFFADTDKNKCF